MKKKITKLLIGAFAFTMAVFQPVSAFPDNSALNTVVTAEAATTRPGKVKLKSIKAVTNNKIQINWNKTSGATQYRIYYKKYGTSKWTFLRAVNTNISSYTHVSSAKYPIKCGQKYTYTVRAYNSTTKKWGSYDTKGLTTRTVPTTVKLKGIKTNSAKTSVQISWNRAYGGNYYRIYRRTPGTGWNLIGNVRSNVLSYTDQNPVKGQKNIYTVRMYNSAMKVAGGYSVSGLSATIPRTNTSAVGTPKLTGIKSSAYNKITINWDKAANATNYRIYYKIPGSSWKLIATTGSNATSYAHTSSAQYPIRCGQKYTYTVRAYNNRTKKLGSYDAMGLTTYTIPSTVEMKDAKINSDGSVTISWNKAYGGDRYYIYRKAASSAWLLQGTVLGSSNTSFNDTTPVRRYNNMYMVRMCDSTSGLLSTYVGEFVSVNVPSYSEHNIPRAQEIIELINEERAKEGIAPLQYNQQLADLAMLRAKYIGDVELVGINDIWSIGSYSTSPDIIVNGWMENVHRSYTMNPDFKYTGVGVYVTKNGGTNWVQVFSEQPLGRTCTITLQCSYSSITHCEYIIVPWNYRIEQRQLSDPHITGLTFKGWAYKGNIFTNILVNQDMTFTGIFEEDN